MRRGTSPRLGVTLEAARLVQGISLRSAAKAAGVDPGFLHRIEHCQRRPSPAVAGELARVYRLDEPARALLAVESGCTDF
jgi:transcriptional regulator with XRE-family HTH domain